MDLSMEKNNPEAKLKRSDTFQATRVLVVDDDEALNTLFSRHLEDEGFQVHSAITGVEAIASISQNSYHVMLLDYYLPDMDAKELVQILTGLEKLLPFVIMTSFGDEKIAVEMMKLGAQNYFVKDTNLIEVLPAVLHKIIDDARRITALQEAELELQRRNVELARLYRVSGSLISSNLVDLESVSQTIVQVVLNDFEKSNCSLFLYDGTSREIKRMAVDGPYSSLVVNNRVAYDGPGLVSQVIRSG
jgi:DNA-binding NtrC family response regulator